MLLNIYIFKLVEIFINLLHKNGLSRGNKNLLGNIIIKKF